MTELSGKQLISKLKSLNLPTEDFAIFGSGPMYPRGIKELGHDIDIIARGKAWEKASEFNRSEETRSWNCNVIEIDGGEIEIFDGWGPGEWNINQLIDSADIFDGIRYVNLENLLKWKREMARPKDLEHIRLIEDYLKSNLIKQIENKLNIKIKSTNIPPQGMDSEVIFITDSAGKDYVVKIGKGTECDSIAYKLLSDNRINIPVPSVIADFKVDNTQVLILEKVKYPLLESISVDQMSKYLPSMIDNLKKIHQIKSNDTGLISNPNKNLNWKDILLSTFTGSHIDWKDVIKRDSVDGSLISKSIDKFIEKVNKYEFINKDYSLLHTDFNQRNLFVDLNSDQIAGIIDWGEAEFGDPIYDFARVRMLIWHFNLGDKEIKDYYDLLNYTKEQKDLEELYWLSRIIEYLAWYSEELNEFNSGRIKLHQDFLRKYKW